MIKSTLDLAVYILCVATEALFIHSLKSVGSQYDRIKNLDPYADVRVCGKIETLQ